MKNSKFTDNHIIDASKRAEAVSALMLGESVIFVLTLYSRYCVQKIIRTACIA